LQARQLKLRATQGKASLRRLEVQPAEAGFAMSCPQFQLLGLQVHASLEDLSISSNKIYKSPKEIHISLLDLHKSKREIRKSAEETPISSREIHISFSPPSQRKCL